MNHFVYILKCADGTLYTGYTTDVTKRVARHNAGKGAKYTRARRPVTLGFVWECLDRSDALRMERRIKRRSRAEKILLMEAF